MSARFLIRASWALLAAGALPGFVFADEKDNQREALFKQLDRNGDGQISSDEVGEEQRRLFTRLLRADKNEDGKISLAEFLAGTAEEQPRRDEGERRPEPPRPDAPKPAEGERRPDAPAAAGIEGLFRLLDYDRDGKLSADELAKAGEVLKKLDRNGDGVVTPDELVFRPSAPPPGGPPNPDRFLAFLKEADRNGDGKWSREELPERMRENFDRLDTNKDGFIDESEMKAMMARFQGGQPNPGRMFEELDKNKDGKISRDEAPPRLAENFERIDANKDGFLSPDELRRVFEGGPRPDAPRPDAPRRPGADAEKKPEPTREGDKKPEGDRRPDAPREGDKKPEVREGDRKPEADKKPSGDKE